MNADAPVTPGVLTPEVGERPDSIRHLLLRMNRFSIGVAIVLATLTITVQVAVLLGRATANELSAQARIIGANSTAALNFGDVKAGEEILRSLESVPTVTIGRIFDRHGILFATYAVHREALAEWPGTLQVGMHPGVEFSWRSASIVDPIRMKNEVVGYVHIVCDLDPLILRVATMAALLMVIGALTVLMGSWLFSRQIHAISVPLLRLVETMQAITNDKDYSRRVRVAGPAEVATLGERFNDLLQTTHLWNQEILGHRESLERLVEMRTAQWQQAAKNLQGELEERRRAEEGLRRLTDELATVSQNLAHSLESEKRFLANISHEIRTPLNAIIGFSNFALQTHLNARQYDYVSKIHAAGGSLLGIIDDILDLSKIEAGKLDLENIGFNIEDVINDAVNIISHKVQDKGLDFTLDVGADVPLGLVGDPVRIRQILINLMGNAAKFTDTGEIGLRVALIENLDGRARVEFTVWDTGIGMTTEETGRLFSPFSQADGSTTRRFGGTGLGLSISKRLIELMGGEIAVESTPRQGSVFRFSVCVGTTTMPRSLPRTVSPALQGLRILMVGDLAPGQMTLCRSLQACSFRVDVAGAGIEARAMLTGVDAVDPYRIVVLNIRRVDAEAMAMIDWLRDRRSDAGRAALIVIASAGDRGIRERLAALGVDDVLLRPVTCPTLFDAVAQVVAPQERRVPQVETIAWGGSRRFAGCRVLVAEDNHFNQEIAKELLENWGAKVDVVGNGRDAVDRLVDGGPEQYAVVLMDVHMTEHDGFEATRPLRQPLCDSADSCHDRQRVFRRQGTRTGCRHERPSGQADRSRGFARSVAAACAGVCRAAGKVWR